MLYRLPVKAIGRCRCVSKAWSYLLAQPNFIKTHFKETQKQPTESHILISNSKALFSVPLSSSQEVPCWATKLSFPNKTDNWNDILASCDGLVLVLDNEKNKWLINPTTRVSRAVPPLPFSHHPDANTMFGLGYDKVGDDYKVVSLSYHDSCNDNDPEPETSVSVFAVKSGVWRKLESSPYAHDTGYIPSGVFVDGCLHWLAFDTIGSIISTFQLSDEKFYEVPAPSSLDKSSFALDYKLGVLEGCLCMSFTSFGFVKEKFDVWLMKEYGVQESWTKFTILDPKGTDFRPLCFLGKEQMVLVKNEETKNKKLVMYDMKEGTMKRVVVDGISGAFNTGVVYIESIVSPN